MAKMIGGIGASHSPTIGFARDTGKQDDPAWKPIFWDEKFLDLIANDPVKLTQMTIAEYATLGGLEGSEII